MTTAEATRVVESLRHGLPPTGWVRPFTVGRQSEIEDLRGRLERAETGALLLRANYGTGKTHMLHYIQEEALDCGYVVSLVTLDANGEVRFSQMDQIMGAVVRQLQIAHGAETSGLHDLLDAACERIKGETLSPDHGFWYTAVLENRWETSHKFAAYATLVALRAWYFNDDQVMRNRIVDWLTQPWQYKTQGRVLYQELIKRQEELFREQKSFEQLKEGGVFDFKQRGYQGSWDFLKDLQRIAVESGFKGLVLLFDEFESTVTDLRTRKPRQDAFQNLFDFFGGQKFDGMSFFAVTPDFVEKCRSLLRERRISNYDPMAFDRLPRFEMSPLEEEDLLALAQRVVGTHARAYGWKPNGILESTSFARQLSDVAGSADPARTRSFIELVVELCDSHIS
ncbi:MAG: BREX system ATP-binding domain-containing protein [Candidatus Cryosericum sp.]